MSQELSKEEIKKRMQEWRNLKTLNKKAVARRDKLERQLKLEREENARLRKENQELRKEVEELKLQVEELREIIFGKKNDKDKKGDDENDLWEPKKKERKKKKRSKSSYQRELPKEEEITNTQEHKIDNCPDCGTNLANKKVKEFYEEDIPLPKENKSLKKVTKHIVEKGYCPKCKKWHRSFNIPSKKVVIGRNVKLYIAYLSILLRISYSQIKNLLYDTFAFKISNGEIANILEEVSLTLRPEFERIKKRLQEEGLGVHLDETSWRDKYLWVMTSIINEDTIYLAGKNRGNSNIDELIGEDFNKVRVSDAYPAYKNKAGTPQQCWAHPHRKIRDLAKSKVFSKLKRKYLKEVYKEFSLIYLDLREALEKPFKKEERRELKRKLIKRIREWSKKDKRDPKKLGNIKKQFILQEEEWFNCLDFEGVPSDNNKAERMLRHFVIKRKISFGTKTEKSSRAFEINASVLMTYWQKCKENFFVEIEKVFGGV